MSFAKPPRTLRSKLLTLACRTLEFATLGRDLRVQGP